MSKKSLNPVKIETTPLKVEKSGQHVGIRNTEHFMGHCVVYNTPREPKIGEKWILPPEIRNVLAMVIKDHPDIYFGVIYPKEKKFDKKKWTESYISQELAQFIKVSEVIQWGDSTYITLVRNYDDKDLDYLFSTAWNWKE